MGVQDYVNHVVVKRATAILANFLRVRRRLQLGQEVDHYPDFLFPERDGRAELGKERRFDAGNDSIRIVTADGELWIFPDGYRLLLPRPQK
ncbi:hypothetical protein H3H36_24430 [Duganella sp. FT3S]|uniref:Uncharacterized protein n=1 Tax=Rugamonas fusca TaxID=2758568 RepID=A0A7W2EM98_9BURK|nr:hypothetical protein [Rugamonas fusca]MBA5608498.1 hypothetical protein [Rugamonas fusca]